MPDREVESTESAGEGRIGIPPTIRFDVIEASMWGNRFGHVAMAA